MNKVEKELGTHPEWSSSSVEQFVGRYWTYCGKGKQAIVFESGEYVLKLFYRSKELYDLLERYYLAFHELREESGLIAIHFDNRGDLIQRLSLRDEKGKKFKLNPNTIPFLIQKKVVLTKEYLHSLPNDAARKKAVCEIETLLTRRLEKGFTDPKQNFGINFGFAADRALQIDLGKIRRISPEEKEKEREKLKENLRYWLSKYFPKIADCV